MRSSRRKNHPWPGGDSGWNRHRGDRQPTGPQPLPLPHEGRQRKQQPLKPLRGSGDWSAGPHAPLNINGQTPQNLNGRLKTVENKFLNLIPFFHFSVNSEEIFSLL
jgi:hypothetical protein